MPNYNQPHQFYAGVDLHARSMFVHVVSAKGKTGFERDLPANPDAFLDAVQPFRKNLVVGCKCVFAWYWLADLCEGQRIPFVLGHLDRTLLGSDLDDAGLTGDGSKFSNSTESDY